MAKKKHPTSVPSAGSAAPSRIRVLIYIVVTVAVAALAIWALWLRGGANQGGSSQASPSGGSVQSKAGSPLPAGAPFIGEYHPSQGHTHLNPGVPDSFDYNSDPPTSGPHREVFTSTFISPDPLPKFVQVHLLEHGNVLLQYNCSCPDVARALAGIAGKYDSKLMPPNQLQPMPQDVRNGEEQGLAVIVAPYPQMKSKIALSAWTRLGLLTLHQAQGEGSYNEIDVAKIDSFIQHNLHDLANAQQ